MELDYSAGISGNRAARRRAARRGHNPIFTRCYADGRQKTGKGKK